MNQIAVTPPTTRPTTTIIPIGTANNIKPSKVANPKRLAKTKNMAYPDWLEIRKQGIGSSDAATACGLNPYMSMLELWMLKTGRIQPSFEDENEGHAPLYWGKQLPEKDDQFTITS